MLKSRKPSLSTPHYLFHLLITVILLIGLLPTPVLAAEDNISPAAITDLTTSTSNSTFSVSPKSAIIELATFGAEANYLEF